MAKQTLFERLTKGVPVPELEIYNPLSAKVGTFFSLDLIGFRNKPPIKLNGLVEYTRSFRQAEHKFTDYLFADVRLRVIPSDDQAETGCPYHCYLLHTDAVEQWNEGLLNALNDPQGIFNINYDGGKKDTFNRVNNLKEPYAAQLKEMTDDNGDKRIQDNEIRDRSIKYWDFYIQTKDEAGQDCTDFLFVELDEIDGQFTFYKGTEVDPNRISL